MDEIGKKYADKMAEKKSGRIKEVKETGQKKLDTWLQDNVVDPAYQVGETVGDVANAGASTASAAYDTFVPGSPEEVALSAVGPVGKLGKAASGAVKAEKAVAAGAKAEQTLKPGIVEKLKSLGIPDERIEAIGSKFAEGDVIFTNKAKNKVTRTLGNDNDAAKELRMFSAEKKESRAPVLNYKNMK